MPPACFPRPPAMPAWTRRCIEQFAQQLNRYVRERLIPAEADVIANDAIPPEIIDEMREMGLFGLSVPEEYGGAGLNMTQYARVVNIMAYAAPAYRSIFSINVGMFASALKKHGANRGAEGRMVSEDRGRADRLLRPHRTRLGGGRGGGGEGGGGGGELQATAPRCRPPPPPIRMAMAGS